MTNISTEAHEVARLIVSELGGWTLSEIGAEGLSDAIWDSWPPYQKMTREQRDDFASQVSEAIYD